MESNKRSNPAEGLQDKDEDRSFRPRWVNFAPFLGKPPSLTRRQWTVMGVLALVTFFNQYDLGLFSLALKQIQAELAIPEARLGELAGLVRLGALPAFFFTLLADRFGRRRVLIFTVLCFSLFTGMTAFAPGAPSFVVLQFLTLVFAVAEILIAQVVISEEFDPDVRGWGIGALTALGVCGYGLALILFAFVNVLPMGWRLLYLVGLLPLFLIGWLRRSMQETERFEHHNNNRVKKSMLRDALQPVLDLVRMYPARFIAVSFVIFLVNFTENTASFFFPKYFQEAHGWAPWHISVLCFFGGFIGIFGSAFAGRLSDRRGRRLVAIIFLTAYPLTVFAFYKAFGWFLPPLWIIMVFCGMAVSVVLTTFGNELFPTSYRSTASGARMALGTIGGVLGLWVESILYSLLGSHWTAISIMIFLGLATPLIVAAFFRETSGLTLEEIAPER